MDKAHQKLLRGQLTEYETACELAGLSDPKRAEYWSDRAREIENKLWIASGMKKPTRAKK